MKIIATSTLLISLVALIPTVSFGWSTAASKFDSISGKLSKQRYQLRLPGTTDPVSIRVETLTMIPAKGRSGNQQGNGEVNLPLGFMEDNLIVKLGKEVLRVNQDYIYMQSTN